MEARKRQASASTSIKSEEQSKNHIRRSSHSATPAELDEDGKPKRSTRGRNPLPPTSGPLFPPLPPKFPKSRSTPSLQAQASTPDPSIPAPTTTEVSGIDSEVNGADDELSSLSDPGGSKKDLPSGSVNSLTPPPPTSEDANLDMDIDEPVTDDIDEATPTASSSKEDGAPEEAATGEWDAYRRQRAVRGFGASQVKREPEDALEDNEATPRKNGNGSMEQTGDGSEGFGPGSPPPNARTDSGGRLGRKRRGEDQLLLDDHLLPAEMRRGAAAGKKGQVDEKEDVVEDVPVEEEEEEGEEPQEDQVRCVCKTEDPEIMMIQCDDCSVWQHGPCMGIWNDDEAPDEYFCEQCRPELHLALKRYLRSKGKMLANHYLTPTPAEIRKLHPATDKNNPSQSTRWTDPAYDDPIPPPKPPVRSHHRKDAASPIESTKGAKDKAQHAPPSRKAPPGRDHHAPTGVTSHGPPSSGKPDTKKKTTLEPAPKKAAPVPSPSPSHSPPPHGQHPSGKRRSTMNSRDAAYELQMKAALDASRMDPVPSLVVEDETMDEGHVSEGEHDENAEPRMGKRKREDDELGDAGSDTTPGPHSNGKPKHPNQYTYRPKPVSQIQAAASPLRRTAPSSTPVPTLPPPAQHDHGTRRAGAIANGIIPPPPNTISVHNLHWHLPDHLSTFSDILPGPEPLPLEARTSRTMASISRHHYTNQKYGPFTEERDENGKLRLPDEPASREVVGDPHTQLEPPTRVRYPARRIATADVRKRIRNMMEYVSRVQQEESRRKERAGLVGIDLNRLPPATHLDKDGNEPEEGHERDPAVTFGHGQTSGEMMDELMRDLLSFQENFAGMAGGSTFGVSPLPPHSAMFSSSMPVTPTVPTAPTMGNFASMQGDVGHVLDSVDAALTESRQAVEAIDPVKPASPRIAEPSNIVPEDEGPKLTLNDAGPAREALGTPVEQEYPAMDVDIPMDEAPSEMQEAPDLKLPEHSVGDTVVDTTTSTSDEIDQANKAEISTSPSAVPVTETVKVLDDTPIESTTLGAVEGVDVYREGKVEEVITQPEEVGLNIPRSEDVLTA